MARVSTAASPVPEPSRPAKAAKPGKKHKDVPAPVDPSPAPAASGPSSRVNIALPFSQIRLQEPSQELADVVSLLGDLLDALKDTLTAAQYEALAEQADSLRARLH